jgi:lactoylglutathione lyase
MELGAFSVSLNVKDIQASKAFYEKLGFTKFGGDETQNWLILKNGTTTIGLFQGMFDNNVLTFNPGWDSDTNRVDGFTDVRAIQQHLKDQGLTLKDETDPKATGPGFISLVDPDGNGILIDQHTD